VKKKQGKEVLKIFLEDEIWLLPFKKSKKKADKESLWKECGEDRR